MKLILKGFESRIHAEAGVLAKKMPQFTFHQTHDERYFSGWYTPASGGGQSYRLKCEWRSKCA